MCFFTILVFLTFGFVKKLSRSKFSRFFLYINYEAKNKFRCRFDARIRLLLTWTFFFILGYECVLNDYGITTWGKVFKKWIKWFKIIEVWSIGQNYPPTPILGKITLPPPSEKIPFFRTFSALDGCVGYADVRCPRKVNFFVKKMGVPLNF